MSLAEVGAAAPTGVPGRRGRLHAPAPVGVTQTPARRNGRGPESRLSTLRSEAPLILRPTMGKGREPWVRGERGAARVSLTAGAAGPLGGDHLELSVHVGAGATLVLSEISHTLLLPSRDRATSSTTTRVVLEHGATLVWLPEPIISARHSQHVTTTTVDLAEGSRLLAREELLLGRHGEPSGQLLQRVRVDARGRPLYHQDLRLGGDLGRTPPVAHEHRALGSVLVVDPSWSPGGHPAAARLGESAALMPLADGAVLVSALARDSLDLRAALDAGVAALGPPWDPGHRR